MKDLHRVRWLTDLGQSLWLDFIDRKLIDSGRLRTLIEVVGIRGLTSNPAIFANGVAESNQYDDVVRRFIQEWDLPAPELAEAVVLQDIRDAAQLFRPLYDSSRRLDGYVSYEVNPHLALDAPATIGEARRLWRMIQLPNIFIKVPGTPAGVEAVRTLVSEGININITLLFSRQRYAEVAEAYWAGLEDFAARGGDVSRIASVASFFVSRVDQEVDRRLSPESPIRGRVGISNAKLAYQDFLKSLQSDRWKNLEAKGARPQRLLWASTGVKDPAYSDVMYVEELQGPLTVDTVPLATLEAFLEHGKVELTLTKGVQDAWSTIAELARQGISLDEVTELLTSQAIRKFSQPYDEMLAAVEQKRRSLRSAA